MRDIRIWSVPTKRCEAVWLGNLLTLCGCQVWKGSLSNSSLNVICGYNGSQYMDILLFEKIEADFFSAFARLYSGGRVWICGESDCWPQSFWWGMSGRLELFDKTAIVELMRELCPFIVGEAGEMEGILALVSEYVASNNALARNMYTINELFCSRHIDYSQYGSYGVLRDAIFQVERWYQDHSESVNKMMTFNEIFAFTYIQNMINDAYIKAHVPGGFDVRIVLGNANYLLKCNPSSDAVQFLKLRILRNCIHYQESPDELLTWISHRSAYEYRGRAFCEMGDIARENPNAVFSFPAEEYFERANDGNWEEFCGLYKLGYLFEQKGEQNPAWFGRALEMYSTVMDYIEQASPDEYYRTPQEFEYFYKAYYGLLKVQIERDRMLGNITDALRRHYQQELKELSERIMGYRQLYFWDRFYGTVGESNEALSVMGEKAGKIVSLIETTAI